MHTIQKDLLALSRNVNLGDRSLRDIARLIGIDHPEKVKHHLHQLEKKGFLEVDRANNIVRNLNFDKRKENKFINIPIVGAANCGPAELLAEENIEGYIKISSSLVREDDHFAIKAVGDSMNKANINGNNIEDGDYVIIDRSYSSPENGDYVLAVIDGAATMKKFYRGKENDTVMFIAESSYEYTPIVAKESDLCEIFINGRLVEIVKNQSNLMLQ